MHDVYLIEAKGKQSYKTGDYNRNAQLRRY